MMPYVLAAFAAYIVTLLDLWASDYSKTPEILGRCWNAHFLALSYSFIGVGLLWLFDIAVAPNLQPEGTQELAQLLTFLDQNPLWKGAFVGIFASGFANIKLFSVPSPSGPFPIGLQTFTQFLTPLTEALVIEHDNRTRSFCKDHLSKIGCGDADLPQLKESALRAIPAAYAAEKKAAINVEFNEASHSVELLQRATARFGRKWIAAAFA